MAVATSKSVPMYLHDRGLAPHSLHTPLLRPTIMASGGMECIPRAPDCTCGRPGRKACFSVARSSIASPSGQNIGLTSCKVLQQHAKLQQPSETVQGLADRNPFPHPCTLCARDQGPILKPCSPESRDTLTSSENKEGW